MLQDPNVERYVANAIKPLKKQIEELKTEIKILQHLKRVGLPINLSEQNKINILDTLLNIVRQDHPEFSEEHTTGWDVMDNAKIWLEELKSENLLPPEPPKPPLGRVISEGAGHFCPYCHSTMSRRGFLNLFGKRYCDNDKCPNSVPVNINDTKCNCEPVKIKDEHGYGIFISPWCWKCNNWRNYIVT